MPILELESSCYPHSLLEGELQPPRAASTAAPSIDEADLRRWWGIYTKSRQEKALARELLVQRVPFYLPLVPQTLVFRRRRAVAHLPLFSGYLFLFGTDEERLTCLKTNRVSRLIEAPDQRRLFHELKQLRRAIATGAPLTLESKIAAGDRVQVASGPYADLEGIVIRREGRTRLLVALEFMQQGVSLDIDDYMVRRLT